MRLIESDLSRSVKYQVIEYLNDSGYHTYAERLSNFKFVVGDIVDGQAVDTAWMNSRTGTMAIGSGFIETASPNSDMLTEHCLKQLSVLCRHEMLHYLLAHMFRMEKHLKDKGLSDKVMSIAEANAIGNMDNIAADWELSARGYDEDDKEVVRHMTLAGRVIGGLILEDDRPEWKNLTLEELFDKLYDERKQQQQKEKEKKNSAQIDVEEETHSPDYVAMYNKIVAKYDDPAYSDGDITLLVSRLTRGEDFDL